MQCSEEQKTAEVQTHPIIGRWEGKLDFYDIKVILEFSEISAKEIVINEQKNDTINYVSYEILGDVLILEYENRKIPLIMSFSKNHNYLTLNAPIKGNEKRVEVPIIETIKFSRTK